MKVLETTPSMLIPLFEKMATDSIQDALDHRGFISFTGNTVTSYTAGIYVKGSLENIVYLSENRPPVRIKIQKGQFIYLDAPFEGEPRGVKGRVDATLEYGMDTSLKFLRNYRPSKKHLMALVVTTGTEYSEFLVTGLEDASMTDISLSIRQKLLSNIKSVN